MNVIERIHAGVVYDRRLRVLAERLAHWLPPQCSILDIGCGDGRLARRIGELRPDVRAHGVEVLARPQTFIPLTVFDGRRIPFADSSFDVALFVDVLHHSDNAELLLREARRVARRWILIKDHTLNGLLAGPTLRFMDWVGNVRHGVALPYNYWPEARWRRTFAEMDLHLSAWENRLHLYPPPASWFFDRSLHFIAQLEIPKAR